MRRRDVIRLFGAAAVAPWGSDGHAEPARDKVPDKVWRIGIIVEKTRTPPFDGFLQGMSDLGYVAGRDYNVDWRFANGRYTRVPQFVEEFAKLKTDLIFLGASTMAEIVRQATRSIPIVLGYSTDPVGAGLATSLARPGGNVTGMASSGEDPAGRQLALLAAVVPGLSRVALLRNPEGTDYDQVLERAQPAARKAGIVLAPVDAREPSDLKAALPALRHDGVAALLITADPAFLADREAIAALALANRLPSISPQRDYAQGGGLMSCGEDLTEFYRRAATFADRIFKGARPGDLPIEQPAHFHLAINRATAAALGLTVPRELYAEADEVFK